MKRLLFSVLSAMGLLMLCQGCSERTSDPSVILRKTWKGYTDSFIREGRVVRPKDGYDTVSEGQAYAMLRALAADDRETFDAVLRWTERHLSRKERAGDRLLSWRYADGAVVDANSAADADTDYALALVLASRKWRDASYLVLAKEVMNDILDRETRRFNGRLYLLPWPLQRGAPTGRIPQNLSYYSPAHFRIFFEETADKRWLELVETGYHLQRLIQRRFNGETGSGLLPDWCEIGADGIVATMPGRSASYGWEAVRIPLRLAMDYLLYGDGRALDLLRRFSAFYEEEYAENGMIYSEYSYGGEAANPFEHPLFYTAAFAALEISGSSLADMAFERVHRYLKDREGASWYLDEKEYYANSLCWLAAYYLQTRGQVSEHLP